ncbi:glyoxylase-like metal-dependent hydrolase (beta-lactamase superfamily II) [Crossiella equi]|uniref:Glyoxylase-like metal-dependent hydrolase (Beta-lactamase superfamily II) n=1 Tax=Crossiella equi TaxID=130796 RepID=A0ABS5AS66_9PSEU|nr:MBL fold metallo-hydrolase [Crossiella equi]MBP2479403.1 glyoxylase-like metal-dependent hydrolase (beta-lactamase superfamily II) [Crossiella equi]
MASGSLNEQSAVRSLQLGQVRLTYVVDGPMGLSPEGFFPAVPSSYWTDHPHLLDPRGRVAMSAGGLLVERDGRRLLVDAGMGDFRADMVLGQTYLGTAATGTLPEVLSDLGHRPEDIEAVAFTHLHVDHTGWAYTPDGTKFFPGARYLVSAPEWAPHARGETIPGAPPRATVIDPLAADHIEISDGDEVFPGVHALVTPGHSPGHTSYVVSTEVGRVVAFGDVFHIPAQLTHPEWPSLPDVDTDAVRTARHRILRELDQPNTLGFGCHFGDQVFGRVVRDGQGRAGWLPVPATEVLPAPRQLD